MSFSVFYRHKVKDFDVFKEAFWAHIDFLKQNGAIETNVLRDLDDPNVVIVHVQLADAEAAKAMQAGMNSDGFRKGIPVTEMGAIPETLELWVAEDA